MHWAKIGPTNIIMAKSLSYIINNNVRILGLYCTLHEIVIIRTLPFSNSKQ